jgi:hypothetical protein
MTESSGGTRAVRVVIETGAESLDRVVDRVQRLSSRLGALGTMRGPIRVEAAGPGQFIVHGCELDPQLLRTLADWAQEDGIRVQSIGGDEPGDSLEQLFLQLTGKSLR